MLQGREEILFLIAVDDCFRGYRAMVNQLALRWLVLDLLDNFFREGSWFKLLEAEWLRMQIVTG